MSQGLDLNKPGFLDALISSPIRINFEAVATGNLGPSAPSDPKEGQEWIDTSTPSNIKLNKFLLGTWITVLTNITAGPPSQSNVQKVIHTEVAPATTWVITHGLGNTDLSVAFWDALDESVVPDTVITTDDNTVTATFLVATAGRAVVIG